ncbi:MAG: N-acetyltransferase [bacterium]|nr:N-acetyltransferase [bacterium]MDT8366276.1 N-acetyltransferase [bacterium]
MTFQIIEAESGQAFKQFINFPWSIYLDDPYWVPPLKSDVKDLLSLKHPFYQHAERKLFLAIKNGQPVGRIAAIINHRHNEFHSEKTGFFGFFESVDDQKTADALLAEAEKWIQERGMDRVLGPVNPSTNEECGLLVHNFLSAPFVMMTYNPPYYRDLIDNAGYGKAKDLYAYWYHLGRELPNRLVRMVKMVKEREPGLVVRPLDKRRFDSELEIFRFVYNEAWEKNWGFVPMTDAELSHMAKKLKPLVIPSLINLAFVDDEPAGIVLGLPDYNNVLKILNGTILNPFRTVKALRAGKRIRTGRCLTVGVREKFRKRGIESLLFAMTWQGGIDMNYRYGELSWVLEDNQAMIDGATRAFSAEHYKTYRIYEKQLAT